MPGEAGNVAGSDLAELNTGDPAAAARAYAALGWPVIPIAGIVSGRCGCRARARCTHPGKHPLCRDGTRRASTDPAVLADWWSAWPWAGVGIVTGRRSGLVVVDVDPGHGGEDTLAELVADGLIPATLRQHTGSGGQHLLYRVPASQRTANTSGRLADGRETPGIDLRGSGGYIVAAPSPHLSGRRYQWDSTSPGLTPAPAVTFRSVAPPSPPSINRATPPASARGGGYWDQALTAEVARVRAAGEGARNDALNRAAFALGTIVGAGALERSDVQAVLMEAAVDVGVPGREAERTIRSGLDAGEKRPRTTTT